MVTCAFAHSGRGDGPDGVAAAVGADGAACIVEQAPQARTAEATSARKAADVMSSSWNPRRSIWPTGLPP